MTVIVLPVKQLGAAKTRQSSILTSAERRGLTRAMLRDVAAAVEGSSAERVLLISSDPWALRFAARRGWDRLVERTQRSEAESVDAAAAELAAGGVNRALRLPADIPLLRPRDIDQLLSASLTQPGALIVPSRDGTGTNALLRSPPNLFPSRFGPGSFALHLKEAARVGVSAAVVKNPRIALDLDDPADLAEFLKEDAETFTRGFLVALGIPARLPPSSAR